jgi:Xaa-Pro aminopeptidase
MNPKRNIKQGAIRLAEHQNRREAVLEALNGAVGVVFAGEGSAPLVGKWRPDFSFLYLTGLDHEAGAAVLFDPTAEDAKRRIALFLRPMNPELERWDGYREQIGQALKDRTGFKTVMRATSLPAVLTTAARRAKRLACLHPFSVYPAAASADLEVFRKLSERVPGVKIEDRTNLLPQMRAVKSPAELALMKEAAAATAAGYAAAMRMIRPGVSEADIANTLEQTYRAHGSTGVPYNHIVGSGLHGTVLHYMDNSGIVQDGDLIVIDSAAEVAGYAADVTRTFPVNGRFTKEQREAYEVVLRAHSAAIKAARPGVKMCEVDAAGRDVIEKAGYGDLFIHGIGHQLGLQVHDVTPDGALKAGMVITIEPGVYFPEKKMGIRIEDDVLVTGKGREILTADIPRTIEDVEAAMRGK